MSADSPGDETATQSDLNAAIKALADGALVAFPTETVYGLGADATSADAVAGIYRVKGRPVTHPLIVHIGRIEDLHRFGRDLGPLAERLADAFWPGPLTLIVGRGDEIAPEAAGGRSTVGLRMPDHPLALELLDGFAEIGSGAIAAPSANRYGEVSSTTAKHVRADFGDEVAVVLDGGPSRIGIESTIVDLTGPQPRLLRPGGISAVEIEAVTGTSLLDDRAGESRAPGMMASHYAPEAEVVVVSPTDQSTVDGRGFDGIVAVAGMSVANREPGTSSWVLPGDAAGYAARLYSVLRDADRRAVARLLIVPPVDGALLDAVLDRLSKAAAPRGN